MNTQTNPKFIHLHTHSHYSLLNALPKIPELIEAAKNDGQTALALTEDGNLYSAIEFYKTATKEGIKPIIGVDLYIAPRTRFDKEHKIDNYTKRLVLLAKNKSGYDNIIKIVTYAFLEGFYYRPRADFELLKKYGADTIAILPSFSGAHTEHLKNNDMEKAKEITKKYKDIFQENLYFEITHHPEIIGHRELQDQIKNLAEKSNIPLVAAQDVYYMKKEDNLAREMVRAIGRGTQLLGDEIDRPDDFSFITQKTAQEYFKEEPEALANSVKIAEMCNLELDLGHWIMPDFPKEDNLSYDEMLRKKAYDGIKKRGLTENDELKERIEYELGIIKTKGYSAYFLVVADLMRYARKAKIYTNTRGSAAGSFVSYLVGITNVNPLDYNLPFERFLNPERPSAPDVDMDIADNKRDELIDYARKKYGEDHVAQIGTFGSMAARAAVRDVARALGYSYSVGDRIAKLIPFGAQGFTMTIDKAIETEPELKEAYQNDSETREILDLAKKIEGNARHMGVHAAGVIMAPKPAIEYTPLQFDPNGDKIITQYDMYSIADEYGGVGLLKFDFLGLKNLAVLADAIRRVKKLQDIEIDIDTIPLDDKPTFDMLSAGHTMGVFQMASAGMTKWLMELQPSTIHDINAMVALYRPGPMQFIPDYIERKRDPSKIKYIDPRLEKYLKQTFGILIYQDDVMLIAVELAGYSWGEADKFRKAMGKKIPEEMARQKNKFHNGCVERGMKPEVAKQLWEMIETFAAYGFNKSHSVSYGNLAYRTAYMKANYPLEFMSALLTADSGDTEKISAIIEECKTLGIKILPPDINESFEPFSVVADKNAIRFGLMSIKNFGEGIAKSIVDERKKNGAFKSLSDFLSRVADKNLNKRALEALIKAGALDRFEPRSAMLENLETLLEFHRESHNAPAEQASLFGNTSINELKLPQCEPLSLLDKLKWEKELLGLYISGHPIDVMQEVLKDKPSITQVKKTTRPGITTVIAGVIDELKIILTKKNEKMAFVKISDKNDSLEVVVFPKIYSSNADKIIQDKLVLVKGQLTKRNGELSFQAEAVKLV